MSLTSSAITDVMMTMPDGSVMSMSPGMVMSDISGISGTGAMSFTGAAGRVELGGGIWGVGMVLISLGAGVGFLAGVL